jgi:hypothetical protein
VLFPSARPAISTLPVLTARTSLHSALFSPCTFSLHCPLGTTSSQAETCRDSTAIMCIPPSSVDCTLSITTPPDTIGLSYFRHTGHHMRVTGVITKPHAARQTRLVPMCFQPHLSIVNDEYHMPLPSPSPGSLTTEVPLANEYLRRQRTSKFLTIARHCHVHRRLIISVTGALN